MESGKERIAWPLRKLNERERNYIFESEKTMRFLDLLYGAVLFAFLIYVSDFFTMKMQLLTDLSWVSIIVFGAIGFFNVLYIIRKHDRILWAVKENCNVSDGTVLFKRFLFFGKQSGKATGVASVYCTPTTGNTKIYRPFPIRLGQFGLFQYKSNAVILWIEGTGNPNQALAVKMRY